MIKSISIFSVVWFAELMQRLFKCGDIQNTILTPHKELHIERLPTSSYAGVMNF